MEETVSSSEPPTKLEPAPILVASFGIGCFHFSSRSEQLITSLSTYYSELENLLNEIPHITNVSIVKAGTFSYNGELPDDVNENSLNMGIGITPWPNRGSVSFDILIPSRFQAEHVAGWRKAPGTENFAIKIVYTDAMPVAFVYAKGTVVDNPSTMVVIVRKHLESTFPKDRPIKFTYLGPSPYHADFLLYSGLEDDNEFTHEESSGYDTVHIYLPNGISFEDSRIGIEWRYSNEIGFYYKSVQDRNHIVSKASDLFEALGVQRIRRSKGYFRRFLDVLTLKGRPTDLRVSAEMLDIEVADFERSWISTRKQLEAEHQQIVIEPMIEREIAEVRALPLPAYRRIADAIEGRRVVASTNRAVLVAAIVSGIISVAVSLGLPLLPSASRESGTQSPLPQTQGQQQDGSVQRLTP